MDLESKVEKIKNKEDFEEFLEVLLENFNSNKEDWENATLPNFLEALCAYAKDIDGYYSNMNIAFDKENPTWKVFADLLIGAKVYE